MNTLHRFSTNEWGSGLLQIVSKQTKIPILLLRFLFLALLTITMIFQQSIWPAAFYLLVTWLTPANAEEVNTKRKLFRRSVSHMWFGGVIGGISEYTNIHVLMLRFMCILLLIASGFVSISFPIELLILYFFASQLIPDERGTTLRKRFVHK